MKLDTCHGCLICSRGKETKGRESELLGRRIKVSTEQQGMIYTPATELAGFEHLQDLIGELQLQN